MCKCGCNTCESIRGPLLTEGRARKLYSRGVLDLCEEDEGLMETHLGEFDLYKNEIVPLDLPMLNERKYSSEELDRLDLIAHHDFDGKDFIFLS